MSLGAIAIGATVVGSVVNAIGAVRQGQAANAEAEYRARLAEQDAQVTRQQAEREQIVARQDEEDFRRNQAQLSARRRAVIGGSGVDLSSGSPLLATEDFAGESELQALRIRAGGETTVTRLEQQAGRQQAEAGLLRRSGRSSRTAGFFRAGSLLLSGGGRAFNQFDALS